MKRAGRRIVYVRDLRPGDWLTVTRAPGGIVLYYLVLHVSPAWVRRDRVVTSLDFCSGKPFTFHLEGKRTLAYYGLHGAVR
jgi:hypothetical protein